MYMLKGNPVCLSACVSADVCLQMCVYRCVCLSVKLSVKLQALGEQTETRRIPSKARPHVNRVVGDSLTQMQ